MKLSTIYALMVLTALSCTATSERNKSTTATSNNKKRYDDDSFSPVVLRRSWNTLFRLTILVLGTIAGLMMDGFFVTTFFIAKPVRKIGNVFLVFVGLADLLISGGAMLICVVVLMSDHEWDTPVACRVVHTIVVTSTYCYSIFFSFVAIVSRCRVKQTRKIFRKYLPALVSLICCLVFIFGLALAIMGVFMGLDHDYCERKHTGNYLFRLGTGSIHLLSFCVTVPVLITSIYKLKHRNRGNGRYKRSYQFQRDMNLMKVNLFIFLLYVAFWTPHLLVVNFYPDAPDSLFYITAYVAVARSSLSCAIYGLVSQIFVKSYLVIFNYCCCKIGINNFRSRQARPGNGNMSRPLRTHILMQPPSVNGIGPHDEL